MILFTILTLMIIALAVIAVLILSIGGTVFTVFFADIIVCIFIIVGIIKFANRK